MNRLFSYSSAFDPKAEINIQDNTVYLDVLNKVINTKTDYVLSVSETPASGPLLSFLKTDRMVFFTQHILNNMQQFYSALHDVHKTQSELQLKWDVYYDLIVKYTVFRFEFGIHKSNFDQYVASYSEHKNALQLVKYANWMDRYAFTMYRMFHDTVVMQPYVLEYMHFLMELIDNALDKNYQFVETLSRFYIYAQRLKQRDMFVSKDDVPTLNKITANTVPFIKQLKDGAVFLTNVFKEPLEKHQLSVESDRTHLDLDAAFVTQYLNAFFTNAIKSFAQPSQFPDIVYDFKPDRLFDN